MNLKNGRQIDRRCKDSWGTRAFVFWDAAEGFSPCMFLVRGDSFEDAYEWFLCDSNVERRLAVTDSFEDYIEGWDGKWVYGVGNTNKATLEQLGEAYFDGKTIGITINDNGTVVHDEQVQGQDLREFARTTERTTA